MDVLKELNRLKVETGSLACLGCGHEHGCDVHGCAILREAEYEIERLRMAIRYDDEIMKGIFDIAERSQKNENAANR